MENRYLVDENIFLPFAKEIFSKHFPFSKGENQIIDFDNFYNKLSDKNKDKILKISFFYYYRGWKLMQKEKWYEEVMEDFIFIVLISITECLVSKDNYEEFIDWIEKNHKESMTIKAEKEIYLKKFGSTQKFKQFFNTYLLEEDRESFIDKIKAYSEKDKKSNPISIDEIASLFYNLRSDFVHNANYIPLSAQADGSSFFYGKRGYSVWKRFTEIVLIFERGFINYFNSTIDF